MKLSILSDCLHQPIEINLKEKEHLSLDKLKQKICQSTGISSDEVVLFQNGKLLSEENALIGTSSILFLKLKLIGGIKILIKIPDTTPLEFDLPNPETKSIRDIKKKINMKKEYKEGEYILNFNGQELTNDDAKISSLNAPQEIIMYLIFKKPTIQIKYKEVLKHIELEMGFNTTVSDLQKLVKDKLYPELANKELVFAKEGGYKLNNENATLNSGGINQANQIVEVSIKGNEQMFLNIEGKTHSI